nr:immunoglobulin light chain junction region [Macaca mulatta]MPN98516.1 immunoglobulin light chain junction region [Macaca mulatta]
CQQHNSHPLTV